MIRFLSKHEMSHMAVPYTVDLILFNVAVYPLGERDSERLKDRTVVVYLALHGPGMGVGQVGGEHFPVRAFYHQEHVIEWTVVPYDDRYLDPVCGGGFEEMLRHYSTSILPGQDVPRKVRQKTVPAALYWQWMAAREVTLRTCSDLPGPVGTLRGSMVSREAWPAREG
jgi:hypothetical protein